jgi:energy-coupling factor transporter ATP-binding protein EcfA2
MKLKRAQIENFRSVEDSTAFEIDPGITCLVGKNESGKTSLLTALYRLSPIFDTDPKFDYQKDYPRRFLSDYAERHGGQPARVVKTWWAIEASEKSEIAKVLGPGALTSDEVHIEKDYADARRWTIKVDEAAIVKYLVDSSDLHNEERTALGGPEDVETLKAKLAALPDSSPRGAALIEHIDEIIPKGEAWRGVHELLEMPKFLLFSQYQQMQGQVSLEQVQQRRANKGLSPDDQVFIALCDLAGTTVENAASIQQFETLISKFEGASNKISGEIFKYWSQNRFLKVHFRLDRAEPGDPAPFNTGRVFRTRVENQLHQVTVPFDDRSTGFVWFFSFLALFSQVKKRSEGRIILLLDEPGLSLHGKAQADLLRYFKERLAPDHQVIYTTHSPFMVPSDNLLSVRTVEDVVIHKAGEQPEVRGTKVGGQVLSTDRDTLFPLQGALGYEITQSLFVGKHTLLVEGPSDLLYLKAMSEELRSRKRTSLDQRWTVCPTGGVDKVSAFMSLFGGNSLHIAVLADFASGQKKKVEDLRRSSLLQQGHVLTVDTYAGQGEADIEDVLGGAIYIELVNACYGLKGKQAIAVPQQGGRIVKFVDEQARTWPAGSPEFDHYTPSAYLTEHRTALLKKVAEADLEAALVQFEKLFADVNALLPKP